MIRGDRHLSTVLRSRPLGASSAHAAGRSRQSHRHPDVHRARSVSNGLYFPTGGRTAYLRAGWPVGAGRIGRVALVKITEESLREQAGDRVFEQALAMADKVAGLSADGPLIVAAVDGIPVSVRIGPRGIEARCGCPAPGPCPHAVAVALAWVRTGEDEQVTDLFETLRHRMRSGNSPTM